MHFLRVKSERMRDVVVPNVCCCSYCVLKSVLGYKRSSLYVPGLAVEAYSCCVKRAFASVSTKGNLKVRSREQQRTDRSGKE